MIELRSESAVDTRAIAAVIAGLARAGDLIVLAGKMGAGKTAFAQGFARALGVFEPVTSPTYTLVHTYAAATGDVAAGRSENGRCGPSTNSVSLHHADLYRLEHTAEVADLALAELLEDNAVVLVEWGDKVELGEHLQVELRVDGDDDLARGDEFNDDVRFITVTSSDRRWDLRWDRLATGLRRWVG